MSVGAVRANPIEAVVRQAAEATGVDFGYLLRTAKRESALNPAAKARTSSAAGLFQFVEQTWLGVVKKHGAKHGYGQFADMISRGADGRLRVSGPEARKAVLDLRFNAKAASVMAGELASDHAAYLKGRIGREPNGGELYVAHFLGPAGSAKLIEAAERNPGASAASLFPAAASANRPIFYEKGRALSVAEVYADLTKTGGSGGPASKPRAKPVEAVSKVLAETVEKVREASEPFNMAAMRRADRARRDDLLMDMILGGASGGSLVAPFSAELLTLLADSER